LTGRVSTRRAWVRLSTRDQVARLLSGVPGLIVPRAVRLQGSKPVLAAKTLERGGIAAPVILRRTGTHAGKIVGLFDSVDAAVEALTPGEHIATEFVDFA